MGLKIIYSNIASRDLKEIYNYIRRDSLKYARKEVKDIQAVIRKAGENPFFYRVFEKANDEFTREMIFKNYRIIYDVEIDKRIIILSIHHHSRLISNNPAFSGLD